ncbi:hypothetical protein [Palleronia rufa]|uniref:hypothetical protein n=1 Tax=Palleronia rufa TaxID=1530186 RepID=UPI0005606510|nr:hypothetical protein [Palleronia rufa]
MAKTSGRFLNHSKATSSEPKLFVQLLTPLYDLLLRYDIELPVSFWGEAVQMPATGFPKLLCH